MKKVSKKSEAKCIEMTGGIIYGVCNNWIRHPETNEMPYKIGYTTQTVGKRYYGFVPGIRGLMPGNFETLFAYKFDDCEEAEKMIHGFIDDKKIKGEWFHIHQKELNDLKEKCEIMGGRLVTDEIKREIENQTQIGLADYLKIIGKKTFVQYYKNFQNDSTQETKQLMASQEKYTKNSIDTKVSIGKKIFKEKMEKQALEIILTSRADEQTKVDALKLLNN